MSKTTKTKPVTPVNMRKLACDIMDWLKKQEMFENICILVDNEMWQSEKGRNSTAEADTGKGTHYWITKDVDIKAQLEYSNPKTISLTFEGALYHKINYDDYNFIDKMTEKFLKPFGLYFEQGYAWSMAAYH